MNEERLLRCIRDGRAMHAMLIAGPEGSGRAALARKCAAVYCCGEADPARLQNCPDYIELGDAPIGVNEVRALIESTAAQSFSHGRRAYLLKNAHRMTPQAQNAILKTIEEPPSYGIFMLLTNNVDMLLPTIQSRCVRLDVKPVSDDLVKKHLMENLHVTDYQADVDASFAQGNIGKAEAAAQSAEFENITGNALEILKKIPDMEMADLIEYVKKLTSEKDSIYDYLDLFQMWFRDVLMFKATYEVDNLIYKQEINTIKEQARVRSYEGLEKILEAIDKAKIRLRANVNFETAMQLLFLTIREN